ncbi:MAG: FADH(2)-oxidizing methylenetetrahydrofolate--tRNA-(uracil(54)-C(5))-methyltransferase TrmFO, partial [Alphaproteobacteria bacterium]
GLAGPDADFQPMNVNFGLMPAIEGPAPKGRRGRVARRKLMTDRAKRDIQAWLTGAAAEAA